MSRRPDVVVAGGGIVGLTIALAASTRGLAVVVIDEPRPGAASRASAGMLAPSLEGLPEAVRPLALEARDYYPGFLARLREQANVDAEAFLDRNGVIEVASTEDQLEALHARAREGTQLIDHALLCQLEPALSHHAGALGHPNDGSVDVAALMTSLDVAVARDRRIHRVRDSAASFALAPANAVVWTQEGTRHEAPFVVLATGAWVTALPGLPRSLPVRPVRGQLMRLAGQTVGHVTFAGGGYLVPRLGSLVVGATDEEAGFANAVTSEGLGELRAIAGRAVIGLQDAAVAEHWAGLRPITPDGMPILGPDPQHDSLVYACGFSRNGVLLAPWAAEQLSSVLAGAAAGNTEAFSIDRFS